MSEALTYDKLLDKIISYAERGQDAAFAEQLPGFIQLAENRIATEVKNLGLKKYVTGTFTVGTSIITKPTRWRETVSWNYGSGTGNNRRNTLFLRTYEYCRTFWPDPTVLVELPRFYADYDYDHFLVVGTPSTALPFELVYYEKPIPLDSVNQANWTTEHAPQLLIYATLLEAQPYLKLDERVAVWQAAYDRAASGVSGEEKARTTDQSNKRKEV